MIGISVLALGAIIQGSVTDYFPLAPGTKWQYHERGKGISNLYIDEVKPAVKVGESPAVPIETKNDDGSKTSRYYRVENDTVYLVANDPAKPLMVPVPILKMASGKTAWTYVGKVDMIGDLVPMEFSAECVSKGKQRVLDSERECVEVTMNSTIDAGRGLRVITKQVSVFAKGVGLVEMRQTQIIGASKTESSMRLIKFEPPP